jgi:initiation factor 1A
MVKNTAGGSKHKSMARKNMGGGGGGKLRMPEEEGECFAKVTRMLGNGMCSVVVWKDNVQLTDVTCFIRGKFRSRNKKQNFVATESFILVGLRDWSSSHDKCDLLHVYDDSQLQQLSSNSFLFKDFSSSFNNNNNNNDNQLIFTNHSISNHSIHQPPLETQIDLHLDLDLDLI